MAACILVLWNQKNVDCDCVRCLSGSNRRGTNEKMIPNRFFWAFFLSGVGSAYDLWWWLRLRPWAGQYIHVLGELGAEGLHNNPAAPAPTRSVAACAPSAAPQTARDGGRALSVVCQSVGLWVSCEVVLAEAVSSVGASGPSPRLAFLWNRPQGSVLQRLRVGVLAGLHEVVQVEVARDERGGLTVGWSRGSGSFRSR